jgi:uncharacterized protein YbjT (DUF2867 family)
MQTSKILITGATGKVGGELVKILANEKIQARVISRNYTKAAKLVESGFDLRIGDLADPYFLKKTLDQIEKVFLIGSDSPDQSFIESQFIHIARNSGVKHIVKSSAFVAGLTPPVSFGVQLFDIEEQLKNSGMAWTILRPCMFMQNFPEMIRPFASSYFLIGPFGSGRVSFIDVRDVASVAFNALVEPGHENKTYELTGPEAITFKEVASILTSVLNQHVRYLSVPSWIARKAMVAEGMSAWTADRLIELAKVIRGNGEAHITRNVELVGKKKPYSFLDFAMGHKQQFVS